jgi:hypothetical protein
MPAGGAAEPLTSENNTPVFTIVLESNTPDFTIVVEGENKR